MNVDKIAALESAVEAVTGMLKPELVPAEELVVAAVNAGRNLNASLKTLQDDPNAWSTISARTQADVAAWNASVAATAAAPQA